MESSFQSDLDRRISTNWNKLHMSLCSLAEEQEKGRFVMSNPGNGKNEGASSIVNFQSSFMSSSSSSSTRSKNNAANNVGKGGLLRNMAVISLAFTLLFSAFHVLMTGNKQTGEDNKAYTPKSETSDEATPNVKTTATRQNVSYEKGENRRMLKNLIVISLCFTLLFTAFNSMANLQSSLNSEAGLGPYSLATLYAALVLSSMFLPSFLIQKFTAKWTLVFSMFGYVSYISAQFYPTFATLIPAAIVLGLCAAPLWASKCTYLTHLGHQYADVVSDKPEAVIGRFFGIFFFTFQSSQIWGNLISSSILSSGNSTVVDKNISFCGANFCPNNLAGSGDVIQKPSRSKIYLLAGIYLGCAVLAAILVAVLVDSLARYGEKNREGNSKLSGKKLLSATFRQMANPIQIAVIPLTVWSGMEQGFFGSDFTQAFITCSWGVGNVGYIMICYGFFDAMSSISFGPVVRRLGRIPVFVFGAVLNVAMIFTMIFWRPNPTTPVIFFVIAGFWGISDGIWQTQINSLYGVLFKQNEEAAFSNYRLWESIGYIIAYVETNQLCVDIKLYVLLAVISVGLLGYFIAEVLVKYK